MMAFIAGLIIGANVALLAYAMIFTGRNDK